MSSPVVAVAPRAVLGAVMVLVVSHCTPGVLSTAEQVDGYANDMATLESRLANDPTACLDYIDLCELAQSVCLDVGPEHAQRCADITERCQTNVAKYCANITPGTPDAGTAAPDVAQTPTNPPPTNPTGKVADVWDQIIPAGFVTSADVGLPAGWKPKQTISGDFKTTADGEVVENLLVKGTLIVSHNDVVVRNCRVYGGPSFAVQVTGKRALVEHSQLGLDPHEAKLTKQAAKGGGDTIEVDAAIPVGATVYLSASVTHQEQFLVVARTGSGPSYTLKLERRVSDNDVRSPAVFGATHPKGDTIAWYDPAQDGPLPGNGVSGGARDYTVRRNLIQAVNDGLKQVDGLTVDNLIRLQFYVPPAHLDGIQTMHGNGGRVLHNTILRSQDSTSVLQSGQDKGPITGLQWKWNLQVGAHYHCVRWYGTSGDFHWNRWLPGGSKPLYVSGQGLTTRDLRYTDGTPITVTNFSGGPDTAGDGSGAGNTWGNGYASDPDWQDHFALPGNPEYSGGTTPPAQPQPDAGVPPQPVPPPTGAPGTVIVDDPSQPRTWPAAHGEAMVSLWANDALATVSVTIDDNTKPDHDWWSTQGKTYGLRFTWFVITGNIGTPWGGQWADFQKLVAEGHDVQSHTVTHLKDVAAGKITIEDEYRDSQKAIEANLPGVRALTLAYPGGTNKHLNDDTIAAKYYIGARSGVGHDNDAVGMSYMRTNSVSGKFNLVTDHWAGIPNLITLNPSHASSFRGFHCIHYHQVGDKAAAQQGLSYLKNHANDIWVGLFREVMQYGQQRDVATLEVPHVSADRVVLELTDNLDDSTFDFPLTVKVGLASHWKKAQATQGGKPVPVKIVQHGGKPFALVQAVPDAGQVDLVRAP